MRRTLAVITSDGAFHPVTGGLVHLPQPQPRVAAPAPESIAAPTKDANFASFAPMDEITRLLARVVKLAQPMNEADQRRVRDFVHAASATLAATTVLPRDDQDSFLNALREAARS